MNNPYALIIVDDLDIGSLDFRLTLDNLGYSTELVLISQINLEQISQIQPDIIFAHFSLPEGTDLETLAAICEDERLKGIPTVGITTYKEVASVLCSFVDTVMLRPVNLERLSNLLTLMGSIDRAIDESPWDALTGLFSPAFFTARLGQALKHSQQVSENQFVVYSIGLDQLMKYEKKFGKEHRTQILQGVSKILKKILRSSDIVSHFEEGQFLVLIEDAVDRFAPTSIAERILAEFDEFLVSVGLRNRIRINIGGIYCTENYEVVDEILYDVRHALRMARQDRQNSYKVYERKTLPAQERKARTMVGA